MTKEDVIRLTNLHFEKHGVPGMLGSIDCTHFFWKNFPMGWQGHYQGKEKKPTIVIVRIWVIAGKSNCIFRYICEVEYALLSCCYVKHVSQVAAGAVLIIP